MLILELQFQVLGHSNPHLYQSFSRSVIIMPAKPTIAGVVMAKPDAKLNAEIIAQRLYFLGIWIGFRI